MKTITVHRVSLKFDYPPTSGNSEDHVEFLLALINELLPHKFPDLCPQLISTPDEIEIVVEEKE